MIVRKQPDGSLILVNQSDHAKLSGILGAHWGNGQFMIERSRYRGGSARSLEEPFV